MRNRRRFLKALGQDACVRVKDEEYADGVKFRIASLHFHPEILDLCGRTRDGKIKFPTDISSSLATSLSSRGCAFTSADKHEDGTYCPLPNYATEKWEDYVNGLEIKAGPAQKKKPDSSRKISPKREINTRSHTPTALDYELLKGKFERQASDMERERKRIAEREKELRCLKEELDKREAELVRTKQDVDEKIQILMHGDEAYGLTRNRISCRHWHKKNPDAARTLFGFPSWKELVYIFNGLFGVLPPTKYVAKDDQITPFEEYLLAYLRIHTGMTVTTISFVIGRHQSHCSRLINSAAKSIGQAGKALSILDIDPEYLELTCPQQYKDEGLEKCCAVPDGKDFMIHTTRKNTLFTRASYSDKVHHSAVRCISWSSPEGLSFEHTNLFLARVSEKGLVELWGKRLRKCPRRWFMLSDRGFFDTARLYPNMNHQKTPKFLSRRDQFTEGEVSADRAICKLRYTCEVAFSRVTKTSGPQDVIPSDLFSLLDIMNHWGHATINLDRPLMK